MPIPGHLEGGFAGGYSINEGAEYRFTDNGLEATVVYTGPWENQGVFLDSIFGKWNITYPQWFDLESGGNCISVNPKSCCADFVGEPCPLPTSWTVGGGGSLTVDSNEMFLYPDTYSVVQSGDPLDTQATDSAVPPSTCYFQPIQGCDATITINYRQKWHARWPMPYVTDPLTNAGLCLCNANDVDIVNPADPNDPGNEWGDIRVAIPKIAKGTYIEILEMNPSIEWQTLSATSLRYTPKPQNIGSPGLAGDYKYPDDTKCFKKDSNGNVIQNPVLPKESQDAVPIYNVRLVVRWMNLPYIPDSAWRAAEGKVNERQFLSFPKWSVYFSGAKTIPRGVGAGTARAETLDADLEFIIKMVDGKVVPVDTDTDRQTRLDIGIVCGRMGYYNRRWSKCPIEWDDGGNLRFRSNWVHVQDSNDEFVIPQHDFSTIFPTDFSP